jgi:integrase
MAIYDTRAARPRRVLSVEEATRLVRACADPCERAVVGLLVEGGLRPREVGGLRAEDLRRGAVLVRGKDGRERPVVLGPQLSETLRHCVRERGAPPAAGEPLLLAADGRPLNMQVLGEMIRAVAQRAGFSERLSAHVLRATAARRRWRQRKRGRGTGTEGETR